ncbi:MAG: Dam family site-specific DNA-(adenine-N6)-methyltransferase [Bacteroidales bacterium]
MNNYRNQIDESAVMDDVDENNMQAKPFLKWVGGKRQLLEKFQDLYPLELKESKIKNYYEPFLGGGAVFFDIAQNYEIENAYLYDINDELILTYIVVQKDVYKLIDLLANFSIQYKKLSELKQKEFYYEIRESFNTNRHQTDYRNYSEKWILRAAQIIFLNKTCFNGLFRFNSKGEFNSPQGRYKNPKILDEQNLLNASKLLVNATIKKADFREIKRDIKNNSFVYFDPPYKPISTTANFTAYNKKEFPDEEQVQLAGLFDYLDKKGHWLMLSNSDPKNIDPNNNYFDKLYGKFKITRVEAKRSINSNPAKRNAINEIVVTNY